MAVVSSVSLSVNSVSFISSEIEVVIPRYDVIALLLRLNSF